MNQHLAIAHMGERRFGNGTLEGIGRKYGGHGRLQKLKVGATD